MSASPSVQEAFNFARRDFLQSLTDPHDYDFSQYNSIEQVYDATEKIQKEQEKSGTLRNLNKIQPYLECMSQYVQTIDTFVQVKPEILAVIWVCSIANISVGSLLMIIQRALSNFCCK
jgi:nitrate/nitrite-specific signal transduction histidine kinase